MKSVTILCIILSLLNYPFRCKCCIELLNGQWSQMSVEERAERSEIVVLVKVLKNISPPLKTIKFYSSKCMILDVLKGWEYFKKDPQSETGWNDTKTINVYGFGSTLNCLSDVQKGKIYVLFGMFKVDLNLWATYFTSFGAVEEVTADVYSKVSSTLGLQKWSPWSICSKECGGGLQQTRRTCVLNSHCDYSWSLIKRKCNWQSCDKIIQSNKDLHIKKSFFLKNSLMEKSKMVMISLKFANNHSEKTIDKQSFVLKMIENKNSVVILTVTKSGIIQIDFQRTTHSETFTINTMDEIFNYGVSVNIFINETSITFEHSCQFKIKQELQKFLTNFFSNENSQLIWNVTSNTDASFSTETFEVYRNLSCQYKHYNHSTDFNVMLQEEKRFIASNDTITKILVKENWSAWSKCSVSCGIGWQKRERECFEDECDNDKIKSEIRTCYIQEQCNEKSCSQICKNGGQCINKKCFCENGYHGEFCEKPICLEKCKNNGVCVSPNKCHCTEGFDGRFCEIPKCEIKCLNDGQCLEPNVCTCTLGFEGVLCEKRKCSPGCQNNGVCQENNFCKCPPGVIGSRCEKYECYPQCMNGGSCVGVNKCRCPNGFIGLHCEKHICDQCFNGGKCVDNTCQCPLGFYGDQCQSQICVTGLKFQKLIKPVIIHFPGTVNNKICLETNCKLIRPQRSVVVNKVIFKPYIGCL